ncbi:hypothetical protein [Candidatus Korobacter versatilis]|nr:hypothetical protein [Candidatus Koribacter versatilis]
MEKIKEVVEARSLFTEAAVDWSVMKWLSEKKRVRKTADACNATLDRVELEMQQGWSAELKTAYESLSGKDTDKIAPDAEKLAKSLKEAHDAAIAKRMEAEETFEKAEKRMSVSMAREGCQIAMAGWDLHEAAIKKSETAASKK